MNNQTVYRFPSRDRTHPYFAKIGLFAGLLAVMLVISPIQILAQGSGLNEPTRRLFQAVHDNNMSAVQISVTDGANIEAVDENGLAPVDIAVDEGFFDIAHFLLSVRNARDVAVKDQSYDDQGQGQVAAKTLKATSAPVPAAPVVKKLSGAVTRPTLPPLPVWPKGKPNPFDPKAPGATLPVLGKVEGKVESALESKALVNPPPKAAAAKPAETYPVVKQKTPSIPRLQPAPEVRVANVEAKPPASFIKESSNFFSGLFGGASKPPSPETPKEPKPINDAASGGGWVVRDVKTYAGDAKRPTAITEKKIPPAPLGHYLSGITLTLGRSVRLGAPRLAKGGAKSKPCIEKKNGTLAFCIETVDWPERIKPYFQVNSIIYQGAKAIARYDDGVATSYYVIFPTGSYPTVVKYYTKKFGNPTKTLNRSIAPLAKARRKNPTTIWQSIDTVTKQVTTLEVREFDDTRGIFPDTRHGVAMLYQQWSSPIFPNLSTMELIVLNAQTRINE